MASNEITDLGNNWVARWESETVEGPLCVLVLSNRITPAQTETPTDMPF